MTCYECTATNCARHACAALPSHASSTPSRWRQGPTPAQRPFPLLARAAGALGDRALFDTVIRQADALLDQADHTSLFNPYALHEIRLRGLVATDRAAIAIKLADDPPAATTTVAPQWHVIQFVTIAGVRLRAGDRTGSRESLETAIREANARRLPHQLQRIMRTAAGDLPDIHADAEQALDRLRQEMAA
ncbi:hypothetical protein E1264_13120 [Actinomadura sp. KC216]|uniref:hypothetical protein n=1 Tax=Actinomadura sp. KC216 TaxID=2530370 RepID=UPI001053353B|nr:hypothetical protein [Actinomadura sp. KC216]TDB87900.1 hypothetical protein E1264_13120 [Actinomadura sp. KC216]